MGNLFEKKLIIGGILITYWTSQTGSKKPTLVFLHGWGSSSAIWMPVFTHAFPGFHTVFIDLPGFGKSEQPNAGWGVGEYASCVLNVLTKLDIDSVVCVGHSFGGSIALKIASIAPKTIRALILISSAGVRPSSLKKTIIQTVAHSMSPIFRVSFLRGLRQQMYSLLGSQDYLDATPAMRNIYARVVNEDLTPILPEIRQKSLLLWGDRDQETPLSDGTLLQKKIQHARLVVYKNSGHFSFLDQKEKILQDMQKFLEDI